MVNNNIFAVPIVTRKTLAATDMNCFYFLFFVSACVSFLSFLRLRIICVYECRLRNVACTQTNVYVKYNIISYDDDDNDDDDDDDDDNNITYMHYPRCSPFFTVYDLTHTGPVATRKTRDDR